MQLRKQISHRLIESNPIIVSELRRYYYMYGRPKNTIKRAGLSLSLYVKYGLFRIDPQKQQRKEYERLSYPESENSQLITYKEWERCISKSRCVVFDAWYVLLQPTLEWYELASFVGTALNKPDIPNIIGQALKEEVDYPLIEDESLKDSLLEFLIGFTLDNEYMHKIYSYAQDSGCEVCICNLVQYADDDMTDSILKAKGYEIDLCAEIPADALVISTKFKNNYIPVNILGNKYRQLKRNNVVISLYEGIVNLKLHGQ